MLYPAQFTVKNSTPSPHFTTLSPLSNPLSPDSSSSTYSCLSYIPCLLLFILHSILAFLFTILSIWSSNLDKANTASMLTFLLSVVYFVLSVWTGVDSVMFIVCMIRQENSESMNMYLGWSSVVHVVLYFGVILYYFGVYIGWPWAGRSGHAVGIEALLLWLFMAAYLLSAFLHVFMVVYYFQGQKEIPPIEPEPQIEAMRYLWPSFVKSTNQGYEYGVINATDYENANWKN